MSGIVAEPPTTTADLTKLRQDMEARIAALPLQFVAGGDYLPVAQLLSDFPASQAVRGKYARVSDLWGSVQTVMVCDGDASGYYWRPQRTDYAAPPVAMTGGTMQLVPLVTAPIVNIIGTLASAITIRPTTTNVWPGAQFIVRSDSILGLFGITIAGLVGAGTIPLLSGGTRTLTYFSGTGWKAA